MARWSQLPTKFTRRLASGQACGIRPRAGAATAIRSPRPGAVLADVRNGKVTTEGAARDYGVVVLPSPWHVDARATAALRAQRAAAAATATDSPHEHRGSNSGRLQVLDIASG